MVLLIAGLYYTTILPLLLVILVAINFITIFVYIRKVRKLNERITSLETSRQGISNATGAFVNSENGMPSQAGVADILSAKQVELQLKEQELLYHTLVITDLKQRNGNIGKKFSPFQFRFSKKKDQEEYQCLLKEIITEEKYEPLQEFEIMFKQMHGGFYEKLLSRCPDLSRSELQVSALLRMNLSSKEIARLTHLSASTIDITRHKIRKKLGLDQQESLTGFLIQV